MRLFIYGTLLYVPIYIWGSATEHWDMGYWEYLGGTITAAYVFLLLAQFAKDYKD